MTVFAITLGFMPARVLDASLRQFARTTTPGLIARHVLLDQHYPLDKAANSAAVRELCAELGIDVLDAGKNLGLHGGFNYALEQLGAADGDIVIAYDGDSFPNEPAWDLALARTISCDHEQRVVWSSLLNPRSKRDIDERGYAAKVVDGLDVRVTQTAVTNSVCAWRYGWLKSVGFLTEPCAFYGHLETAMFDKLGKNQWAFVPGWSESDHLRDMQDRAYQVYKWCHAHLFSWAGDFESWLAAGSPNPEDSAPERLP